MSNDKDNAENLELQKVLAASLAYTQKEFRRAKRELIEEFKEVLDPETGQSIKILEIKVREDQKGNVENVRESSSARVKSTAVLMEDGVQGPWDLREKKETQ